MMSSPVEVEPGEKAMHERSATLWGYRPHCQARITMEMSLTVLGQSAELHRSAPLQPIVVCKSGPRFYQDYQRTWEKQEKIKEFF